MQVQYDGSQSRQHVSVPCAALWSVLFLIPALISGPVRPARESRVFTSNHLCYMSSGKSHNYTFTSVA